MTTPTLLRTLGMLALLLAPLYGHATTRLVLDLEELIDNSALIFTGVVDEVGVVEENGLVYSVVRFEIEELIKGDPALATIELRFLGGATASAQTEVAAQFIPDAGAVGLWFVDDTTRELVNPLTGWSQGYFPLIEKADGTRWLGLQGHPDYGILEPATPLADKMRAFNFPEQQIDAQFPRNPEYPLADFIAVIRAHEQGLLE